MTDSYKVQAYIHTTFPWMKFKLKAMSNVYLAFIIILLVQSIHSCYSSVYIGPYNPVLILVFKRL